MRMLDGYISVNPTENAQILEHIPFSINELELFCKQRCVIFFISFSRCAKHVETLSKTLADLIA